MIKIRFNFKKCPKRRQNKEFEVTRAHFGSILKNSGSKKWARATSNSEDIYAYCTDGKKSSWAVFRWISCSCTTTFLPPLRTVASTEQLNKLSAHSPFLSLSARETSVRGWTHDSFPTTAATTSSLSLHLALSSTHAHALSHSLSFWIAFSSLNLLDIRVEPSFNTSSLFFQFASFSEFVSGRRKKTHRWGQGWAGAGLRQIGRKLSAGSLRNFGPNQIPAASFCFSTIWFF